MDRAIFVVGINPVKETLQLPGVQSQLAGLKNEDAVLFDGASRALPVITVERLGFFDIGNRHSGAAPLVANLVKKLVDLRANLGRHVPEKRECMRVQ